MSFPSTISRIVLDWEPGEGQGQVGVGQPGTKGVVPCPVALAL